MRADMPWQGYKRKIAPQLSAIAAESVLYENAYTISSYTAKSVGGLLAGRYPSTLYRGCTFFTQYSEANLFFTELLQAKGRRTMAVQAHLYFNRGKKLRQGFDLWKITPGITWNATTDESVTSPKTTALAIELLSNEDNTKQPFFLWLHYMDPHDQYKLHPESPKWGRKNRDRYDSEMFYTDLHIKKLLDFAAARSWWSNTALIVTADHGEAFGEHNMYKHAFALWEVLTHVPLMFKLPGVSPRRVAKRRSHIDLAPTILDLMGVQAPAAFMGKSMVAELYGLEPPGDREPIVLDLPADTYNPPTRAVLKGDYKLIVNGPGWSYYLYNLKDDPGERRNLAKLTRHKAKLVEMKALFEKTWQHIPYVKPYGGKKMLDGERATGPRGPSKDAGK